MIPVKAGWLGLFAACMLLGACELQDVEIADTEDVVIAEVVLRAGASTQLAWLHRTRGPAGKDPTVRDASIRVQDTRGGTVSFLATTDSACMMLRGDTDLGSHGTCYTTQTNALPVVPGETYQLLVSLPGGLELTGVTTVPSDFKLLRPSASVCAITPLTPLDVEWTESPNAWVYAAETSIRGIRAALKLHNVNVNSEPLRLFGLSYSARDTGIVFPGEFGLFDRFDDDLTEALAFMQRGLPDGVVADVVIAAADRNYVNWERGGAFNPSGPIRVPSVHGAGTGVFGSLVPRSFQARTDDPTRPPC